MECENQHQKISFSSEICPLCATYDLVQEIRGNISELYTNLEALIEAEKIGGHPYSQESQEAQELVTKIYTIISQKDNKIKYLEECLALRKKFDKKYGEDKQ